MIFPSIRSFLAFTYTIVVVLIISVLGVGIQLLVENRLRANVNADLNRQAQQISRFIVNDVDTDLTEQINRIVEGLNIAGTGSDVTYIRLYDASGLPMLFPEQQPSIPQASPKELRTLKPNTPPQTEIGTNGTSLLVLTRRVSYHGQTLAYLQLAKDLEPINRITSQLRQTLITGIILAGAIAGAVSYGMAWQALKPFSEIVEDTEQIGVNDLDRRLPDTYGVEEVGRLARSFNALLDRLQRAFNLQRRFVADASHELRTPLTTIRGNIEVLLLDPDLPPSTREALEHVSGESARLSRLVTNLLLLARADAGHRGPQKSPVDIHGLVLETLRQIRPIAGHVHLELTHEDQAMVLGDMDMLKQVLLNLLDNAVKYTPNGGHVYVGIYQESGWVVIEISDTGAGISRHDMEHVFDRFYRSEKTRQEATGSGLGLSIVNWVIQAHGGHVTVESEAGKGSTFTVHLPLAPDETSAFLTRA